MTILTSKLALTGKLATSILSIVHINNICIATDADGREQASCKGFVLTTNICFAFVTANNKLWLTFHLKGTNSCAGDVPDNSMNIDHIPGFERYMKKAGFELEGTMKNMVSIVIRSPSRVNFGSTAELLARLTQLLLKTGAEVPCGNNDYGEPRNQNGLGSAEFDKFSNAFDADTTLIDQQ
jgi:hypothetical protein